MADFVRDEIEGRLRNIKGDHADLMEEVREAIATRPPQYFGIKWVNSHTPLHLAEEVENQGGFERRHIEGNYAVDLMAKGAIRWHDIDWLEFERADDREFIACVVQAMLTDVWTKMFEQDNIIRGLEDDAHDQEAHDYPEDEHGDNHGRDDLQAQEDPLDLPNQRLARYIQREALGYAWARPPEESSIEVRLPKPPARRPTTEAWQSTRSWARHGQHLICLPTKLRGACPLVGLRWWGTDPAATRDGPLQTTTYLECVVDFELATGFRLGDDGACGNT